MKRPLIYLTTIGYLILFPLIPLQAQSSRPANPATTQPLNPNATFEDYKKECLAQVKKDNVLKAFAEELCTCTMNQFRQRYSLEKFRELVKKSQTDRTARRTLEAVGEECASEIIFEP